MKFVPDIIAAKTKYSLIAVYAQTAAELNW